jgi:hypothetical protein
MNRRQVMSDHELVIYEDGEIAFECHAKSEGPDSPPCWYTDAGENMGACNAVAWVDNGGIDLYDEIRIPVTVEWHDNESGPMLIASREPERVQSHSRVTLHNQDTRKDVFMCACGAGPFDDAEVYGAHRYNEAEEAAERLRVHVRRLGNDLARYKACDFNLSGEAHDCNGLGGVHTRRVWHKEGVTTLDEF